jgi:hypothetical protein
MAGSPGTYENIKQVPLAVMFTWRGKNQGTQQADAWAKNVFVEKDGDQVFSVKRPGLSVVGSFAPSGYASLSVQCVTTEAYFAGPSVPRVITNDYYLDPLTGAIPTWSTPLVGGIPIPQPGHIGCWYSAMPITMGTQTSVPPTAFMLLHDYTYIYVGGWTFITHATQSFQLASANSISDAGFLPGFATLDGTWYLATVSLRRIWASALGDPNTWPALNYVTVDKSLDALTTITNLNSYVIVFGVRGLQLWYDAGISPGSPLAAVQGGILAYGMHPAGAFSLAKTEDSVFWLGTSPEGALAVYRLQGTQVTRVSTPGVERYLTAYFSAAPAITEKFATVFIRGSVARLSGHDFYMLTYQDPAAGAVGTGGVTLVYDFTLGTWVVWTQQTTNAYGEGAIRSWQIVSIPSGVSYVIDPLNGNTLTFSDTVYQDAGQKINTLIQTETHSWGNQRTKVIAATYPLLDTVVSSVGLSWTDDDYQTFVPAQSIDTSTSKKQLIRCGSTVQRAWQLTHTDNTPMRFYDLEVEVIPGAL